MEQSAHRSILVVDDDPAVATTVEDVLREAGHRVVAYTSARAALASMTRAMQPDVIVVDWQMPGIDGLEFVERLLRAGLDVPVVVMSGQRPEPGLRGVSGVLRKPFALDELLALVDSVCARARPAIAAALEGALPASARGR